MAVRVRRNAMGRDETGRLRRDNRRKPQLALFWRGQFECPRLFELWIPLHERLVPAKVLPHLYATALRPFQVSNRYTAFVYRDQVCFCFVSMCAYDVCW